MITDWGMQTSEPRPRRKIVISISFLTIILNQGFPNLAQQQSKVTWGEHIPSIYVLLMKMHPLLLLVWSLSKCFFEACLQAIFIHNKVSSPFAQKNKVKNNYAGMWFFMSCGEK